MFTLDRLRFEHYVIMLLGLVNVMEAHLRGRDVVDSSITRHILHIYLWKRRSCDIYVFWVCTKNTKFL